MLVKTVLQNNGSIVPLIIPEGKDGGIMNPSIYTDGKKLICNLRHVKYTIYHSRRFPHKYGPLQYIHAENDLKLRTVNYIAELNEDLSIKNYKEVKMLDLHTPVWDFIGLEDARLFRWDNKLYLCGVRRDTTTNGQGRMELTELNENYEEISRCRLPAPIDTSYCEKNWMPILDQPHNFVKWTNPTEVVNVKEKTKVVNFTDTYFPLIRDLRGSSHVIPYKDKYIAITHEVALYKSEQNQKDANYLHRIVVWDKNWNIYFITDPFYFFDGPIEFCAGAAIYKDNFLISFGHQDNAAYILSMPLKMLETICNF
jgi:hypothetical protein